MSSPFKQKGKNKPGKKKAVVAKVIKTKGGGHGAKNASDGVKKSTETADKGSVASKHGKGGVSGRTQFAAASKALALNKGEGEVVDDKYTIADVLRRNA